MVARRRCQHQRRHVMTMRCGVSRTPSAAQTSLCGAAGHTRCFRLAEIAALTIAHGAWNAGSPCDVPELFEDPHRFAKSRAPTVLVGVSFRTRLPGLAALVPDHAVQQSAQPRVLPCTTGPFPMPGRAEPGRGRSSGPCTLVSTSAVVIVLSIRTRPPRPLTRRRAPRRRSPRQFTCVAGLENPGGDQLVEVVLQADQ